MAVTLVNRWVNAEIAIDATQIRQALLNLIQNAVQAVQQAGPDQPQVRITIASHSGIQALDIAVEDNGPGVPIDERQRIFTPFYTTKDHGTGLGLAIVHSIVDLHGGTLAVDDSQLGGACVRMIIPS